MSMWLVDLCVCMCVWVCVWVCVVIALWCVHVCVHVCVCAAWLQVCGVIGCVVCVTDLLAATARALVSGNDLVSLPPKPPPEI